MKEIINQVLNIQNFVKNESEEEWIDLRLRFFENNYELLWGDPSFDQDHRGYWGYSTINIDSSLVEIKNAVKDMLIEIDDQLVRYYD